MNGHWALVMCVIKMNSMVFKTLVLHLGHGFIRYCGHYDKKYLYSNYDYVLKLGVDGITRTVTRCLHTLNTGHDMMLIRSQYLGT